VWFGLGMFGLVGWSVAVPTLIGIVVGVWLDARAGDPQISWTLTGLVVGVAVGCGLAWFWVRQEAGRPDGGAEQDEEAADDQVP
jgi:ATP synthase protein I